MTDRVLVSGASGFLGQALTQKLLNDGNTLAVVQRPTSQGVDPRCARIKWTGDAAELVDAVASWRPTTIFHLATHFVSQHTKDDLTKLIDANIALGTAVLESAHEAGSTIVITGSAWQHFNGADYSPVSLYAATKQALFDIAVHYKQAGCDVRELSLFDTYGPGDRRGKIVSLLLDAAATGQTLDMSSGDQLIDLLYISDAVNAFIASATSPEPETMEAARFVARSERPISIRTLVREVEQVVGNALAVRWGLRPDRPCEMTINWEFGTPVPHWYPRVPLEKGLAQYWSSLSEEHKESNGV